MEATMPTVSESRPLLRIVMGVAVLATLVLLGVQFGDEVPRLAERVEGLGAWGPVAFIAGYVLATIAMVPALLLTLAAGATFGLVEGTAYVFVAATLGACAAFLVSRYFARGLVERMVAGRPAFAAVDKAVGSQGFKIVLLLRLSPVFPFNLMNYALGLTRVSFRDYALACIGMLPGSIAYVYYGKVLGLAASLAGGGGAEGKGAGFYAGIATGLVVAVVVTTLVTRAARRALREATGTP
jgi:uncharacterized membrane protein YdjX (TVP38/TMEM64 family)